MFFILLSLIGSISSASLVKAAFTQRSEGFLYLAILSLFINIAALVIFINDKLSRKKSKPKYFMVCYVSDCGGVGQASITVKNGVFKPGEVTLELRKKLGLTLVITSVFETSHQDNSMTYSSANKESQS